MSRKLIAISLILLVASTSAGCVGTIIGATVDTAIEVAKVPFKVGGAVVDVVAGDDDDK
ncbi:MAG: hypothetical protein ACFCUJ_03315 [Thiotrichales bacterium]